MKDIKIKINNQEYKLKITLGFWKKLSFPQEEFNSIYTNAKRLEECLKLALFYGNKADKDWKSLADMEKVITEDNLDDLEFDLKEPLGLALMENMPESLKKKVEEQLENSEKDTKKK